MMWPYYVSGWIWMAPMMVVAWAALIAVVVWAIRTSTGSRGGPDEAIKTLRNRLAAGEISQDDFERIRRALQG